MQGLILLDKPEGLTSFAAVAKVRHIFGEKRAGHAGTLDPMATGVLPVLIGRATRLCSLMLESDKRYLARVKLGITTDTLDVTGSVLTQSCVSVDEAQLISVCSQFTGQIMQKPPMYSALKKDGVRLYDLARQGIEVERKSRSVNIRELKISDFNGDEFVMDVACSKGTYIRSLAADIGESLGCGAALSELRRTYTAGFDISDCTTLAQLESDPQAHLLCADRCVDYMPLASVTDKQCSRFLHGGALSIDRVTIEGETCVGGFVRIYDRCGRLLGLGRAEDGELKVQCILCEDVI